MLMSTHASRQQNTAIETAVSPIRANGVIFFLRRGGACFGGRGKGHQAEYYERQRSEIYGSNKPCQQEEQYHHAEMAETLRRKPQIFFSCHYCHDRQEPDGYTEA
ncbi:hypothetical protein VU04_06350 [Desulfobulbus sp. TB]|nr:hypothetical protein [Desulfobulbus sp. TB]